MTAGLSIVILDGANQIGAKIMSETIARISRDGEIELSNNGMKIEAIDSMTPHDAAYLARGILGCAVALSGPNPPEAGTIVGDAHLPVMKWAVGSSNFNGEPVIILTVPSGVELTFQMPTQGAKALGDALIARAEGSAPPGTQSSTVH